MSQGHFNLRSWASNSPALQSRTAILITAPSALSSISCDGKSPNMAAKLTVWRRKLSWDTLSMHIPLAHGHPL